MCIAFPNAGNRSGAREPFWKRLLLFVPRLLEVLWMLARFLYHSEPFAAFINGWLRQRAAEARSPSRSRAAR